MTRWGARLAVLAVFVAGFLCGGVTLHLTRFRLQRHVLDSRAGVAGIIVRRLDRELHLTPAQRKQIETFAIRARDDASAVMNPVMPQMTAVFDRLRDETRAVLDDDQRRRFDRMLEHWPQPFARMLAPLGAGPGAAPSPAPTPGP